MALSLESNFKQVEGPEAVAFREYAQTARQELAALLSGNADEPAFQRFLEQNPAFAPGALTPTGTSGHLPFACALISRPDLPALPSRQPDFVWIATNSGYYYPTLIEIESPTKTLFRQDGVPTAEFTEARNQLAQWRAWFSSPSNQQKFVEHFAIPEMYWRERVMRPQFMLVFGRRSEFEGNPELSKLRASLMAANDEHLVSFDRLNPEPRLRDAVTVRLSTRGAYETIGVSPTMRLGPWRAQRWMTVKGTEAVVKEDARIAADRRDYVVARLGYWREWCAKTGGVCVITGDAYEE